MGLLGAILVNNGAYHRVADIIRPEHFAYRVHGRIFRAAAHLIERGDVANPVTLKLLLEEDGTLDELGGARYLVRLAGAVVNVVNAVGYARLIRDAAMRRQLVEAALGIIEAAQSFDDLEATAEAVADRAEQAILSVRDANADGRNAARPLAEFAQEALREVEERKKRGGLAGVPTGLADLDHILGGLYESDLIYVGGRPSMGKSALASTILWNAAAAGHPALLASLEMSGAQVAQRILSARTRVPSERLRNGSADVAEIDALVAAASQEVARVPFEIDERGALTLAAFRARLRRFLRNMAGRPGVVCDAQGKPRAVAVIDYIQLMNPESRRQDNRTEDVSRLSRGLKATAKEFGVPIIVLSQLSRALEARDNKRPMLSDLRESGSIEQDADVVIFVYREEYYLKRGEPVRRPDEAPERFNDRVDQWMQNLDAVRNVAEAIVAKQRMGPTGTAKLHFNPGTTWFSSLARPSEP